MDTFKTCPISKVYSLDFNWNNSLLNLILLSIELAGKKTDAPFSINFNRKPALVTSKTSPLKIVLFNLWFFRKFAYKKLFISRSAKRCDFLFKIDTSRKSLFYSSIGLSTKITRFESRMISLKIDLFEHKEDRHIYLYIKINRKVS